MATKKGTRLCFGVGLDGRAETVDAFGFRDDDQPPPLKRTLTAHIVELPCWILVGPKMAGTLLAVYNGVNEKAKAATPTET